MQPDRDPHRTGSAGRLLFVFVFACLPLLACGGDDGVPADEPGFRAPATTGAPEEEPEPPEPILQGTPVAVAVLPPSGRFPHDLHRGLDCSTCHESVAGHGTHAGIECGQCHELPANWQSPPLRPVGQCMSCHHEEAETLGCATCHEGGPTETLQVAQTFHVASAPPEEREVAFSHAIHARQDCTSCHRQGIELAVDRECASCHIIHHSRRASCLACHQDARDAHEVEAHLGCGGTGCHTDNRILSLPEVRTMCVVCHSDMVDHNPDSECTVCHVTGRDSGLASDPPPEKTPYQLPHEEDK